MFMLSPVTADGRTPSSCCPHGRVLTTIEVAAWRSMHLTLMESFLSFPRYSENHGIQPQHLPHTSSATQCETSTSAYIIHGPTCSQLLKKRVSLTELITDRIKIRKGGFS
ncbi:hypothetical protein GOP47_0013994 [Adiantum capillus-veneris]|uniref:Uncharacterized protein n=1 Tax=Adiantum capillus-veneris TaxID=13818 RepID=A0A9D4UPL0_ADICA|nr:hypothetical protein GOP47_0013994 [Adiantum capillus-veneris]